MDLTTGLYLLAGLGALCLGGGTVIRDPERERNRVFAMLCGALALWNLGKVGELTWGASGVYWPAVFLLGACAAAPLGLHFSLLIAGRPGIGLRKLLPFAYAPAALLWISAWTGAYEIQPAWNLIALFVLGVILLCGLVILGRHQHRLPLGPRRNAGRLLLLAAVAGGLGGISDLMPRPTGLPKIGSAAILLFLLVVCAVLLRHRFLDVDAFLTRTLAVVAAAAAASVLFYFVGRYSQGNIFPLFLTTLFIIAVAGPVWNALLHGARTLFAPRLPIAQALVGMSQKLSLARNHSDVRAVIDEGGRTLPEEIRIDIFIGQEPEGPFRRVFGLESGSDPPAVPRGSALPRLLEKERAPLTGHFLDVEARETWHERSRLAAQALDQLKSLGVELVAPLLRAEQLAGWISVGGGRPDSYLTAEVSAVLMAVGNQVVESLDRIEAVETAKRHEALAAVGEMAAGLAHEVRNPLGAIRGAAQVLASEKDPRQAEEMLEIIQEETERLGRVMGEFLDYARPGSPRKSSVDLGDLVRRVLRATEAAGKGLRAEVRVTEEAPPASGDTDQLQRAFGNLVQNARDAAGAEGLLRVNVAPEGGGRVAVRFEDNGPGIPAEQMSRLFQPFFTTKEGGTGLGLALVHRVIEAHGGEVRVESRPGCGAAFTVVLPAVTENVPGE